MDKKSFLMSHEVWAGSGLVVIGLLALATGHHDALSEGCSPFGVGVILCDALTRLGKATRQTVKVMIRQDED